VRPALFAVLVVPYAVELDGAVAYAVFRPATGRDRAWHALSAEGLRGMSPLDAARWRAWRMAGVPRDAAYLTLDSRASIPEPDAPAGLPEHAFAVRVCADEVRPPPGQLEHSWVTYEIADRMLHCQADRNALWELRRRLGHPASCC